MIFHLSGLVLAISMTFGMGVAVHAQSKFRHAECPFILTLPKGAAIDAGGTDVNRYTDDNSVNVTAVWNVQGARIAMSCTKRPNYPIPPGFAEHLCSSGNPNLLAGSECRTPQHFNGLETFYRQSNGVDMAYFWLYTGHKNGKGRLVLAIGSAPGTTVDEAAKRSIDALVRQIRLSIR